MNKPNRILLVARKTLYTSEVMADREKVTTDYMIENYPDGFTMTQFDMIKAGDKSYPVISIKEDDKIYFNGGIMLTRLCEALIQDFKGDMDELTQQLVEMGGLKLKMKKIKTKNTNRDMVIVELAQ